MKQRMAVAASLLALASCEKPIRCDAHGMIIVPADATIEQRSEYASRNVDLLNRQLDTRLGRDGGFTSDAMEKAEGCP